MSRFMGAAATSHTLSVAAMEEASRFGQRTADVDHLLLALVVNEQVAGQALRSLGITLDSARTAVAAQHADQLATLGVHADLPEGQIVFHETGGYHWGERVNDVIKRANLGKRRGDAAAVLRQLVAEPSGLIEAILHRLGTSPRVVVERLDEAERHSVEAPQRSATSRDHLSGVVDSFIPASVGQVWELLVDPSRMPEWEPSIGRVDEAPVRPRMGDSWIARARTQRADGKPNRVKRQLRTQRVELTALEPGQVIAWVFRYPDAPTANTRYVRVDMEAATGGTQLRIALTWQRGARWRPPAPAWFMRPLARFSVWLQLSQISGGISRTFR